MRPVGDTDSKVILVGDPSVGKTSIIQQYNLHSFEEKPEPTIGASFVAQNIPTSNGQIQIHIWDTAGQERYRSLIPMYSRNAIAAILVVDVTNQTSFEKLEMWLRIVRANCAPNCRIYIVANKIDLDITIPIHELEKQAAAEGARFFRASAKQYETVAPIFEKVGEDIVNSRANQPEGVEKPTATLVTRDPSQHPCC
jgi:small GTP-binding protein